MGDAAAAAASTSAPDTPTSILICREDGSGFLADADDDGDGADLVVARDERLLVVDQDEEYVALLLSEESASGSGGAPAEEIEEWMKAARSGCVRWIIKVVRAGALPSSSPQIRFLPMFISCFFAARRPRRRSGAAGRPPTSRSLTSIASSRNGESM
jgi:cyclin D5